MLKIITRNLLKIAESAISQINKHREGGCSGYMCVKIRSLTQVSVNRVLCTVFSVSRYIVWCSLEAVIFSKDYAALNYLITFPEGREIYMYNCVFQLAH